MQPKTIGILVFNEVEVLDFAGPFEVFSLTRVDGRKAFDVKLVAEKPGLHTARNGLQIVPNHVFADKARYDIVIVPGGYGAENTEFDNPVVADWIRQQYNETEILASVCTGALLLAKAGVLAGRKATTHWMDLDRLRSEFPDVDVQQGVKFVDEGRIITAGGISAGINMSFHLVARLHGKEVAAVTAKRMEYDIIL